jgi:N-acetylmuramoyl-L-alanine amidase
MKFEIVDHLLYKDGEQVEFRQSPNHSGNMDPTLIVIHYTGDNSCEGALSWLCSSKSGVSAHVVIDKDGTVYQLLPFNVIGWHAGKSNYKGRQYVNQFSVGIENVGIGDNWPDEQVESNRVLIDALYSTYDIENIVGHEDVAPGRKTDPGPNYPWNKVTSQ